MALGKVLGVLIICSILSALLCILCRKVFKGQKKAVVFMTWLTLSVLPTVAVVGIWYGVLLIIGKVAI